MEKIKTFLREVKELFKTNGKHLAFIIVCTFLLTLIFFGNCGGCGKSESAEPEKTAGITVSDDVVVSNTTAQSNTEDLQEQTTTTTGTKAPELTLEQKNAVKKAESYVAFSGFSRSGLIEQLEYEGFSTDAATFAADYINVDWNEEAAQKAKSYMEFSSFSRSGLIEQLEYEGFTCEQAEYGAAAVGY